MRRSIYKGELFEIKQKLDNEITYSVFENAVFNDSHKDRGNKLLFVKEEIYSRDKLESILNDIGGINGDLVSEIIDVFIINDDLQIPPDLKEAIKNEQVVLFIGAGVSRSLGYPSWKGLAQKAISLLRTNNKINDFEKDKLLEIADPKEVLTIFDQICPRNKKCGGNFYREIFEKKKKDTEPEPDKNIYDILTKPEFGWKYITTNIDLELIKSLAKNKYELLNDEQEQQLQLNTNEDGEDNITEKVIEKYYSEYFQKSYVVGLKPDKDKNIDNSDVIFLHGIVGDVENSVFTTKDYLKTYFKGVSKVKEVLSKIFQDKTVLFIGYGLSEFAILESIIHFDDDETGKIEKRRHYSLFSTFHSDAHTLNIKQKAFEELNIELIPYYTDFNGFDRLYHVIENWHQIILDEKGKDFFDDRNLINDII